VLRSHLEAMLVEQVGEAEARVRYRRAGELLEGTGALPDALQAYCRGEDWQSAAQLLGRDGEQLALQGGGWIDRLPLALREHDPWLLLALARRHRAAGHLRESISAYERAEAAFGATAPAIACRR